MFVLILLLVGLALIFAVGSWVPQTLHWPPLTAAVLLLCVALLIAISIPIHR